MAAPFAPTPLHSLTLLALDCGRYELAGPLAVTLERQDTMTLAFAPDFEQFGQGESVDDALRHLGEALEAYYDRLRADRGRLPHPLAEHLIVLRALLRESAGPDPRQPAGGEG